MKAMILAAGRGERLRPLTDRIPKPLIPVRGKPLIRWHLEKLSAAGITEIVINVSHLGDQIEREIQDGTTPGMLISWSREREPLETAGGIALVLETLGESPFLLVNADVFSDFIYADLTGKPWNSGINGDLGHLVLVPNPEFNPGGDFSLIGDRVGTTQTPRYTYAGIAVLSPSMFHGVPVGTKAPLGPLLRKAAGADRLNGELHRGLWSDVGTPERLALIEESHGKSNP